MGKCSTEGADLELQQLYILGKAALQSLSCKEGVFSVLHAVCTSKWCYKLPHDVLPCSAAHLKPEGRF